MKFQPFAELCMLEFSLPHCVELSADGQTPSLGKCLENLIV
jgi:hypothetical protein